ncbi:hypothetical protein [Denitromonas halophila]|uniref:SWIM-type domain-containing protein n=1 Tax=Denitromonas halophila TaxID=1629404 RepID=A0A557QJS3_9RHOO|nr:hypothetical protein [Denitromonas halophila]TVO53154.1 hypothetical protein FHP91_15250 [Denitromonas halophila]
MTDSDAVETIQFLVQGSSPQPYTVTIRRIGKNLSAYCTCNSGLRGGVCYHRTSIFEGKADRIVSDNAEQVADVVRWLPGTDVAAALRAHEEAKSRLELARKAEGEAKQALISAMRD